MRPRGLRGHPQTLKNCVFLFGSVDAGSKTFLFLKKMTPSEAGPLSGPEGAFGPVSVMKHTRKLSEGSTCKLARIFTRSRLRDARVLGFQIVQTVYLVDRVKSQRLEGSVVSGP